MNDWRLQGQEKYLLNVPLEFATWQQKSLEWDHDHCEFCGRKFSNHPDDLAAGYATLDKYHWVCSDCFTDFRSQFNWELR